MNNINPDNLEEIKQMLEHALEYRSWPSIEEALELLKEELGYEVDDKDSEEDDED